MTGGDSTLCSLLIPTEDQAMESYRWTYGVFLVGFPVFNTTVDSIPHQVLTGFAYQCALQETIAALLYDIDKNNVRSLV